MSTPKCLRRGNRMARIGDDPWFCLLCPDEKPEPSYTDDVVAVMRATIDQLRADVAELRALNEELRKDAERFQARLDGSPLPEGM